MIEIRPAISYTGLNTKVKSVSDDSETEIQEICPSSALAQTQYLILRFQELYLLLLRRDWRPMTSYL